ncbi:MAG: hypothetical protein AAGN46_03310 [Acidobacteriota bacterium]
MTTTAEQRVDEILQREAQRRARRAGDLGGRSLSFEGGAASAGLGGQRVLVAEGDSWFDYPGTDVLNELEERGWDVHSVAHRGDTLEDMAYGPKQLDGLSRKLQRLAERAQRPRSVLISAGGNDLAGEEFRLLLDHANSAEPGLNEDIVRGLIDVRLRRAYERLIETIDALHRRHFGQPTPQFVLHSYAYPVPDGRGFWGGWGPLPGPWLEPGFKNRNFLSLEENTGTMRLLIDRFHAMLEAMIEDQDRRIVLLDLRETLTNILDQEAYLADWNDELHPEDDGFRRIALEFERGIEGG